MGDVQGTLLPLEFNQSVKLRLATEKGTADTGAVLLREAGERTAQEGGEAMRIGSALLFERLSEEYRI